MEGLAYIYFARLTIALLSHLVLVDILKYALVIRNQLLNSTSTEVTYLLKEACLVDFFDLCHTAHGLS